MGECASAERLESKLAKCETKGQNQMAKTHESNYEEIANSNQQNRSSQIIIYNIQINIFN